METKLDIAALKSMKLKELSDIAIELGADIDKGLKKQTLIYKILKAIIA